MRTLARECLSWGFDGYDRRWASAARAGLAAVALDTRMFGWRYLSLDAVVLTTAEVDQLRRLTVAFGRLLDQATVGVLNDPAWWSELAWPWPAIELARQEPVAPGGVSPYGRFDWLLEAGSGTWQLVEYNADTPSGGREASALESAVWRQHGADGCGLRPISAALPRRLAAALDQRLRRWGGPVARVGLVSSHSWLEDMAQAWWLAALLRDRGWDVLVGDATDLSIQRGEVRLRGQPIQALYRFYPVERLYRHGIFGPLLDAAIDRRVLLLNGLRAFLAQSKAVLAWLWANRAEPSLGRASRRLIERHLPAILPARHPRAAALLPDAVVKHVNGREGDSVVFAEALDAAAWEARLLEGGYVVQRRVRPVALEHVEVDDVACELRCAAERFACVGGFYVGGQFGGAYTRVDGPITTARAVFVPTLVERRAR